MGNEEVPLLNEILKDVTTNGKERPWREKKIKNLRYADYLETLHFLKAEKVSQCSDILEFEKGEEGRLTLKRAWFCHSRLCPICSWRLAVKNAYDLSMILDEAVKREPEVEFLFLTLTEKNSAFGDLKDDLKRLNRSFYKLFQYKKVKQDLVGYVRSTEITVNRTEESFHAHAHVLLMVRKSYFQRGNYLSQKEWAGLWQRARKLNYTPIVNVKKVRASKKDVSLTASAKEVAKYQVKEANYLTSDRESDLKILDELEHALAGTRQISFGGLLKEVRHDLLLDVDEDQEDLIRVDGDQKDDASTAQVVAYKWSRTIGNYIKWQN